MSEKTASHKVGEDWLEGNVLHYLSSEGEIQISVGIKTRTLRSLITQKVDEMTVFFDMLESQSDEENLNRIDELEINELAKVVNAWATAIEEYAAQESAASEAETGE